MSDAIKQSCNDFSFERRTTIKGVPGYFGDGLRAGPFVKTYYYPNDESKRQLVCSIFVNYGRECNPHFLEDRANRIAQFIEQHGLLKHEDA